MWKKWKNIIFQKQRCSEAQPPILSTNLHQIEQVTIETWESHDIFVKNLCLSPNSKFQWFTHQVTSSLKFIVFQRWIYKAYTHFQILIIENVLVDAVGFPICKKIKMNVVVD